jgi:hypothetical protein
VCDALCSAAATVRDTLLLVDRCAAIVRASVSCAMLSCVRRLVGAGDDRAASSSGGGSLLLARLHALRTAATGGDAVLVDALARVDTVLVSLV